jgi:hypothetical protein
MRDRAAFADTPAAASTAALQGGDVPPNALRKHRAANTNPLRVCVAVAGAGKPDDF